MLKTPVCLRPSSLRTSHFMEQYTGLEPVPPAWKAGMLSVKHQYCICGLSTTQPSTKAMATPAGIEPALSAVTGRCFSLLNYGAI